MSEPPLSRRFTIALVNLLVSQFVGEKSVILAKLFYFWFHAPDALELWKVIQLSLVFLLVFTSLSIFVILRLIESGSERVVQVLLFVFLAFLTAGFAIIDQHLPAMNTERKLPLWESIYYFGWPTMLWFVVPYSFLNGSRIERIHKIAILVSVSFFCLVVSGGAGGILSWLAELILGSTEIMKGAPNVLDDPRKFWQASPPTINAICAMFVVVAFAPKWWRNLRIRTSWTVWIVTLAGFAVVYAGIFGACFYRDECGSLELQIQLFTKFGSFALITTAVPLLSLWLVRRQSITDTNFDFSTVNCFWVYLSLGFGLGFALVQLLGLLPYGLLAEAEALHVFVVIVSHALNGFCFGFSLRALGCAARYVIQ